VSIEYRVGDVFDRMAEIPDGSIDLIVTSPPFLALRSYLPADHPDKHKEIGSEPTPAEFIDTLLALSAEWGRVLAPHGSLCVELGDTYSGSGGAGGDYTNPDGLRAGQAALDGSARRARDADPTGQYPPFPGRGAPTRAGGTGWPLAKSMTGIPTLYTWSLAYGRNLLTGDESPAGQWRIRNLICWARPNPPVGALGDKFRPATSYITVACKSARRYFDLDAVRTEYKFPDQVRAPLAQFKDAENKDSNRYTLGEFNARESAGAPPLDWHADDHSEDGDWLWKLSTQPYKGSHYATFPMALPKRLIEAMCPLRVCRECGKPSERVVERGYIDDPQNPGVRRRNGGECSDLTGQNTRGINSPDAMQLSVVVATLGWSDCGHDDYRTGVVLDPFAGSGTTLEAAQAVGRHAIGIDLDDRNADLARERVGMFMEVVA
jgi:DNA modification methylase